MVMKNIFLLICFLTFVLCSCASDYRPTGEGELVKCKVSYKQIDSVSMVRGGGYLEYYWLYLQSEKETLPIQVVEKTYKQCKKGDSIAILKIYIKRYN